MTRRNYSSTAQRTTLSGSITDVATTVPVTAVTGWPSSTPYIIIVDPDTVNEEIMLVTARASLDLTVTRAQGGTTGVAHSSGAVVQHGVYAQDFEDSNAFLNNAAAAPGPVQFAAGSVSAPAITTSGDSNTGIYFSAADTIDLTTGGTNRLKVDSTGIALGSGMELITQAGSVSTPAIYPTGDANTGIYFGSADQVNIATGGGDTLSVANSQITTGTSARLRIGPAGSAANPAIHRTGDTGTGMYWPSAGVLGLSADGTLGFSMTSTGLVSVSDGQSFGPWELYSPTIGGFTQGNGTNASYYCQIGKTVHYRIVFTFGTTSSASSVTPTWTLPVTARGGTLFYGNSKAVLYDASATTYYEVSCLHTSTTQVTVFPIGGAGGILNTTFSTTSPFTWTTNDLVIITGTYEAQ